MQLIMKILITGADGVLGNNLVRELLKRNHTISVLLIDKNTVSTALIELPINLFFGNILDSESVDLAIEGQDVVIHAAASTQLYPARSETINRVNINGTQNIIDKCLKHNVRRMIHVGTANSFGNGSVTNPGNELSPYLGYRYGLDYIDSKRKAQELVLKAVKEKQLPAVIVNPTFMIGPFDTKPSSGSLILALYKKKIPVITSGSKNYIAVKDAAIAIANSIEQGKIGECYILGNYNLSYKEAFDLVSEVIGVAPPTFMIPSYFVRFYGYMNSFIGGMFGFNPSVSKEIAKLSCENHCYSSEKARRELNMPNTDLRVAVGECFEWFKQNGYLTK
jgi:dihydroflavonol-4-reductase